MNNFSKREKFINAVLDTNEPPPERLKTPDFTPKNKKSSKHKSKRSWNENIIMNQAENWEDLFHKENEIRMKAKLVLGSRPIEINTDRYKTSKLSHLKNIFKFKRNPIDIKKKAIIGRRMRLNFAFPDQFHLPSLKKMGSFNGFGQSDTLDPLDMQKLIINQRSQRRSLD
ncbi:unnamed protein product [Blepharisma stoltei]|uniref:Ycf1 n=1 Tax=Blepharisma stoltei TaxID=1481888 RepID=A0AAU9JYT4_9CILI|nr:unnamed protein product [Blepharisma stoltei]